MEIETAEPPSRMLYSLQEAASQLGIGMTKLAELLRNEEIQSVCIGKRRLVRHEALLNYVDQLSGAPA